MTAACAAKLKKVSSFVWGENRLLVAGRLPVPPSCCRGGSRLRLTRWVPSSQTCWRPPGAWRPCAPPDRRSVV